MDPGAAQAGRVGWNLVHCSWALENSDRTCSVISYYATSSIQHIVLLIVLHYGPRSSWLFLFAEECLEICSRVAELKSKLCGCFGFHKWGGPKTDLNIL